MSSRKTILVAGGAGFIGSHFVRLCLNSGFRVINLDALTYAASVDTLKDIENHPDYTFVHGYIQDSNLVKKALSEFNPTYVVNFAAETHVDRSIDSPSQFIESNVLGAFTLLNESRAYYNNLEASGKLNFRFLHISTDEVFGSCDEEPFTEEASYHPSSPYSSSKAAADLIIRSYYHTYQFPILITNCTNNYGPNQFPEKLIPLIIIRALNNETLPVYGSGMQIRDWLYVEDHAEAILKVLESGKIGETYNIAGLNGEMPNIDVVKTICEILDGIQPRQNNQKHEDLTSYVTDRPGHDFRYALNIDKIKTELGWHPKVSFKDGIKKTIEWYLDNKSWWMNILERGYEAKRIGLGK